MSETVNIRKEFQDIKHFLIGEPKQFLIENGSVFCVRSSEDLDKDGYDIGDACLTCPHHKNGCSFDYEQTQSNIIPQARRGIGFEEESFLILVCKEDVKGLKDVPKELWDTNYADLAENEHNIHWLIRATYLGNNNSRLWTIKGQYRFYGTRKDFEEDELSEYFEIHSEYEPSHKLVAFDYSAIEPKISSLTSLEPAWLDVFSGLDKDVAYEITLNEQT